MQLGMLETGLNWKLYANYAINKRKAWDANRGMTARAGYDAEASR